MNTSPWKIHHTMRTKTNEIGKRKKNKSRNQFIYYNLYVTIMKQDGFLAFLQISIVMILMSCSAKDNPNFLLDTQFATEICDSSHILSPKTYSFLHNTKPPLGVKPVVVAVEQIGESDIGTFADDLFDEYCEKQYSGNTFRQRGVLVVVSKKPKLVQVRVGKSYAIYCRMRGSAAGADYMTMQKETLTRGVDEMCPIALNNTFNDINDCRKLPWYKKIALKLSYVHIEMIMDDMATPSESFFNQFYFRPFLFVVGAIKSVFGNWTFSFLFMAIMYIIIKSWVGEKLNAFVERQATKDSSSTEDYYVKFCSYDRIKMGVVFLLKLIITIPTLAAISILSSSRMEDILALQSTHIPSINVMENVTQWTNNTSSLWIVMSLMLVYYIKFLLCAKGIFTYGHLSDKTQQYCYQNNPIFRQALDDIINIGYNRLIVQKIFKTVFETLIAGFVHHNSQEIDVFTIDNNTNDTDDNGKPKKRLIDYFFLDSSDFLYKTSPGLAVQVNTHREALFITFFVGLAATTVLSYTYAVYFLILWTVQLVYRIVVEYINARKMWKKCLTEFNPLRLLKLVWKTDVIFSVVMIVLAFILAPSYVPKSTEKLAEVQTALPNDYEGLYFVSIVNGEKVKGVTARLNKSDEDNYVLIVYSDKPIRSFNLSIDRELGMFHSNDLGDGYIIYDKQTKTITINFSDLWILTN